MGTAAKVRNHTPSLQRLRPGGQLTYFAWAMGEGSHSGRSRTGSGLDVFIPGIIRQISWRQLKISKQKEDKEDTSKACGSIPSSASTPILLIIPSVASSTLFAGSISISWWPPAPCRSHLAGKPVQKFLPLRRVKAVRNSVQPTVKAGSSGMS